MGHDHTSIVTINLKPRYCEVLQYHGLEAIHHLRHKETGKCRGPDQPGYGTVLDFKDSSIEARFVIKS